MTRRAAPGELVLALVFAALGILWIVAALGMPLWSGFVPQSGFMPLWYGVVLTALVGAILAQLFLRKTPAPAEEPVGKPLLVIALVAAGIVGMQLVGFFIAIFALLLVLFRLVERLSLGPSALVAGATTAVLFLVFKTWLGVKLPAGPLGL